MWFGEPYPFPEDDSLPDWAPRDRQVKKGDRVDLLYHYVTDMVWYYDNSLL